MKLTQETYNMLIEILARLHKQALSFPDGNIYGFTIESIENALSELDTIGTY